MTKDTGRGSVVAIFQNVTSAENAVRQLREEGYSADRLGCASGSRDWSPDTDVERSTTRRDDTDNPSFWQKVEHFFSGEEGYEDRDTGAGDGSRKAGMVVDRTLTVPESYHERLNAGCTMVAVYGSDRLDRAEQILIANQGEIQRDFEQNQRRATGATNERRIQLLSEVINVNKQRVNAGEVRVRKEVHTEQQNIPVTVSREELVIERVPVESRPASGEIGRNEEIRVPLTEERVDVEKRPVVREEVRVGTRNVEETRNVTDQTRHEELKVERSGKVRDEGKLRDEDKLDRKRTA